MKNTGISPIDRNVMKRIKEDASFAEVYFGELSERPLSAQFAILRRLQGVTQEKVATKLRWKQAYVSKLEKEGSDHLISNYEKLAHFLHGRLAIIPKGARIVMEAA